MPFNISVIVRGTKDDHTIASPVFSAQADAEADMQKIREAQKQYDAENFDAARDALPPWLIVDVGLILSVSVSGKQSGRTASF
jgi:hypothetical protein